MSSALADSLPLRHCRTLRWLAQPRPSLRGALGPQIEDHGLAGAGEGVVGLAPDVDAAAAPDAAVLGIDRVDVDLLAKRVGGIDESLARVEGQVPLGKGSLLPGD